MTRVATTRQALGGKTMNRRLIASLLRTGLVAACAVAPLGLMLPASSVSAQSVSRPANDVVLSIGRGQLVTVPGRMTDVFVSNDKVADVQIKSNSQLYLFGKAGGETTVYASNSAGDVIWSANVRVGSNLDSVDQMLGIAMPEARVNVSTMNGTVLLTGTVAAPEDAAEAERLVAAFVGEGTNVISRLRMATPLQVNLQVRIAEVSRSFVRDVGVNLTSVDDSSGFKFGLAQGRAPFAQVVPSFIDPLTGRRIPTGPLAVGNNYEGAGFNIVDQIGNGTTIAGFGRLLGLDLGAALDLGETAGLVTTLANPNLTALSGETADFLAGGEFPIPVSGDNGEVTIQYRKYGVSLAYTPTVLANGRISLRVRPEVSELSAQGSVTLNGFQVPGLTIRRAETTVELGSGQSFMIAGLMSNNAQNTLKKTPGAGDIPILGSLFRSTNFRKGETELVIVVTPYLVNPVNAAEIKLPTDGFQSPNDIQRLFGNMENDGKSGAVRPGPTAADGDGATGPTVGALAIPAPPEMLADQRKAKRPRKGDKQAAAAAVPGFSLK